MSKTYLTVTVQNAAADPANSAVLDRTITALRQEFGPALSGTEDRCRTTAGAESVCLVVEQSDHSTPNQPVNSNLIAICEKLINHALWVGTPPGYNWSDFQAMIDEAAEVLEAARKNEEK